jgi:hypothetical protein
VYSTTNTKGSDGTLCHRVQGWLQEINNGNIVEPEFRLVRIAGRLQIQILVIQKATPVLRVERCT